jgi:hypothetical protein
MPDVKETNGEPVVPRDVQAEIRREIRDIVERFGGRRPSRIRRRPALIPSPSPAEPSPPRA